MAFFNRKTKAVSYTFEATKQYFKQNRSLEKRNFLKAPDWAEPEFDEEGNYLEEPDAFLPLFDNRMQQRFYTEGQVALGAVVQANSLLFEKGRDNCPANFIYTREPYFIENPGELMALASELFSTKGEEGYRPSIQKLADLLADEYERIFCYKLPRDLMKNKEVYFTSVFVDRKHLPTKILSENIYPMLILPDNKPDAMILPYWYWKD